jgi:hypothetical protein
MKFVGGLTYHLIPNSILWLLDVSVECFCHINKVSASTIDNVVSKELCRDLDDTTVLSPMFEVERAVDHLVCPNVVMSKGFSTGDGKGFVSSGCRGHIQIICSGGEEGWCRWILHGDFCWNVGSTGCRGRDRDTNIGGSSAGMVRVQFIFIALDCCSAELLRIIVVKRSGVGGRKIVLAIMISTPSQDISQKRGLATRLGPIQRLGTVSGDATSGYMKSWELVASRAVARACDVWGYRSVIAEKN